MLGTHPPFEDHGVAAERVLWEEDAVGDGRRARRRARGVVGEAPVTAEVLWPVPEEAGMSHPSLRISRMKHSSVRAHGLGRLRALAASSEPRVTLRIGRDLVDLSDCGNWCGNGVWCEACRADIRTEALRWLHELNVLRPSGVEANLSWSRAWNREILLADH